MTLEEQLGTKPTTPYVRFIQKTKLTNGSHTLEVMDYTVAAGNLAIDAVQRYAIKGWPIVDFGNFPNRREFAELRAYIESSRWVEREKEIKKYLEYKETKENEKEAAKEAQAKKEAAEKVERLRREQAEFRAMLKEVSEDVGGTDGEEQASKRKARTRVAQARGEERLGSS